MNTHNLQRHFLVTVRFSLPAKISPLQTFLRKSWKVIFSMVGIAQNIKAVRFTHTHIKGGWFLVNNTFTKCLPPATKCWRLFIVTCHNCPNLFKTFLRLQLQDKIFQSIKSGKQTFRPQLSNNDSLDAHFFPSLPQWTMQKLRLKDKLQENANVICFNCKQENQVVNPLSLMALIKSSPLTPFPAIKITVTFCNLG